MGATVISAGRGEGKTSFLREYTAYAADRGRSVGGIVAPAVFEHDGTRRRLARVAAEPDATPTVGVYRFEDAAVAAGNAAIITAVREGLDIIAIDEVGPLEFDGQGWTPALEVALRECTVDQELIVVVRSSLVDELPGRFPSPVWGPAGRVSPPWPPAMLT